LPRAAEVELNPRKTPVQQRSAASVEAIREATIQVLLAVGKEQLTTTRVAHRAGVSVGTLYQYFPNKTALLQSVMRTHLQFVYETVADACREAHGRPLAEMADKLASAFIAAKMRNASTSRALYVVADDVGGAEIARKHAAIGIKAIAAMLASSPEPLDADPEIVATTLVAAMGGVSRRMLESGRVSPKTMEAMRIELDIMLRAYILSRAANV